MAYTGNGLTEVIPQLLAQGLMALRENARMPQLVNRSYERMAGMQGSSIDIPLPSSISVDNVVAGTTAPTSTASNIAPTSVSLPLDEWKEAAFYMSDRERLEVQAGTLPMVASEAIKALANDVDQYILNLGATGFGTRVALDGSGNYVESTETDLVDPFAGSTGLAHATRARKQLNKQLAPLSDRTFVFNPEAEASALELEAFHNAQFGVGAGAIMEGRIERRLGMGFVMDQNVGNTAAVSLGSAAGSTADGAAAKGAKTVACATTTGVLPAGAYIRFAGHDTSYRIAAGTTLTSLNLVTGLVEAVADGEAFVIDYEGAYSPNLCFHRDAIAFATRPIQRSSHPAIISETAVDPISGLTLRLEVTAEHKRDRFSFDILYGGVVVRPELGTIVAGL